MTVKSITSGFSSPALAMLALMLSGILHGCNTSDIKVDASTLKRPKHILGTGINTVGDEFAAGLDAQNVEVNAADSLLFTSNVSGREVVYGARFNSKGPDDSLAVSQIKVHDMPTMFVRNTGTLTRGKRSLVFATSAAIDTAVGVAISRQRGIVGGTDLFEKVKGADPRNIIELNSPAWDAHPSIATNEDEKSEVIVFSSDRLDTLGGFSAPYEYAEHVLANGTKRKGNSDIYIAFRSTDSTKWSAPVNFADIQIVDSINTPANEYSPYLYCLDGSPHILFASNRAGNYNIYDAELKIDWQTRAANKPWMPSVVVERVTMYPMSADSINTTYDEVFPYVKPPYILFSSNRFAVQRPDTAKALGYGGLDIYATNAEVFCIKAPKKETPSIVYKTYTVDSIAMPNIIPVKIDTVYGNLQYDVVVVNTATGTSDIQDCSLKVTVNDQVVHNTGKLAYSLSETMTGKPAGFRINAQATSTLRRTPCNEKEPVLTHYSHVALRKRSAAVKVRSKQVYRDSILQDKPIPVRRPWRLYDTLKKGVIFQGTLRPELREAIDLTEDGRMRVGRDTTIMVDSIPNPRIQRYTSNVRVVDSVFTYDSSIVACSFAPGQSLASMFGDLVVPQKFLTTFDGREVSRKDIDVVIHDTIFLVPQYDKAPVCDTLFGPPVNDEVRNVPYFQTAFWEVNTSNGYRQHMARLRDGDLEEASFVELNWRNRYWGNRTGNEVPERLTRRREDYRAKARIIDASINRMSTSTSDMLAQFWNRDANTPEAKLIVSMRAYSDIRPISVGKFISDSSIRYVATSFDEGGQNFTKPTYVSVAPGATLVGDNNDTLSKLRAYYGFQAVYAKLSQDSLLRSLRAQGLVLLPTDANSAAEYERMMKTARVIVLAEGRYVDTSVNPEIKSYQAGENSYYDLDGVRRVDVHVRRVNLRNDQWVLPECCR
jgi:hypothetical protein